MVKRTLHTLTENLIVETYPHIQVRSGFRAAFVAILPVFGGWTSTLQLHASSEAAQHMSTKNLLLPPPGACYAESV
jgi:hypothetical protein